MLNVKDSRKLADIVYVADLTPDQRLRISDAALRAKKWDDLPAWIRKLADEAA